MTREPRSPAGYRARILARIELRESREAVLMLADMAPQLPEWVRRAQAGTLPAKEYGR